MTHTKRSAEFQLRIRRLAEKLASNTLDKEERLEIARILITNTTDSGCVVKAAEDEPIFVLRGKDPVGAESVEAWVSAAIARDLHTEKLDDAQECADEMVAYSERKGAAATS